MKKILINAGDPSGEKHAADLVKELKLINPQLEFFGIGGEHMRQAGVNLLFHISQLAIMGFTEILKHLPFIRKVLNEIKTFLQTEQPAAVILVDYPGFNLRVAKLASQMGIPVVYYICPQLWAWGEKRVNKIRQYVNLPLVIFKFEEDFFEQHGVRATFVGHPLVDQLQDFRARPDFREQHNVPSEVPIIGLFPGSREVEVKKLLPVMTAAIRRLKLNQPFRVIIAKSPNLPDSLYKPFVQEPNILLNRTDTHSLMKESFLALVASGTATLELGYFQVPMIVMYKVSFISYWLGRMLISIDNIALVNILLGKKVIPELIQHEATPENIRSHILQYFENSEFYRKTRSELGHIKEILGPPGAASRAAGLIQQLLKS